MSRLEDYLVLARYVHDLLGAESFDELKGLLRLVDEGPGDDGQSHFYGRLATQPRLKVPADRLREFDRRVMDYERRLARARQDFKGWRYFQYLAILYTEIFLDRLTDDPAGLLASLNAFLEGLRERESDVRAMPDFAADDLRRLAFFMATGSGKTLLLHVNVLQVLHYLECGRHPETLVRRADGRRTFDSVLLITPGVGLSDQHIAELRASGIEAVRFIDNPAATSLFGPVVKVIEIQKLAEERSREGVSVVLDDLLATNLVIVDEGHKGTGSEARVWKTRQQRLSRDGFLLEYSATFAQAIAAAGTRARDDLLHEYGKAILFDYSYAHFYGDGYGKNFRVLNLSKARASQAHELLMGGLLTFYHQLVLHEQKANAMRPYNIEKPLWIMLGTSVSKRKNDKTQDAQKERTDVAEVVAFLRRVLEEPDWATAVIERVLSGQSGFEDKESGLDLFGPHIKHLRGRSASALYKHILKDVFHGSGGLEVWDLKNAEGEIGLRISAGDAQACPYFAVINIFDVPGFSKHLGEHLKIEVQEDRFSGSQFEQVNRPDSRTHILIGAKKFIEGWSSWRVSSMGLLNVGKGQGPQIMQLFGRGVRLKGRGMSLKRSEALAGRNGHPEGIEHLETLYIFGWNADYIQTFREMLESEDVGREFMVPVKHRQPWPKDDLPVPQSKKGYDPRALTWTLAAEKPGVLLDLTPQLTAVTSGKEGAALVAGAATAVAEVAFSAARYGDLLDMDGLYRELLTYKQARGYGNVFVPRGALPEILRAYCTIRMPQDEARDPRRIQAAAEQAVKTYLDRFVRRKEREAESQHVELGWLEPDDRVVKRYHVRVKANAFLAKIEKLLQKPLDEVDDTEPLPRFYVDWHLFNPILAEGGSEWKKHVSVRPPALVSTESQLVRELKAFWTTHHDRPPYTNRKVFLLRNLPKVGVGLFHRSGFYPDFILWLKDTVRGAVHVRFIDPHGLHHGGLAASEDKFEALRKLRDLSNHADFKAKCITLDGFVLVPTPIEQIPDRGTRGWAELDTEFPLLRQDDNCAARLLAPP